MEPRTITVKGARVHNLRNVSLTLPRGKLICFTGVSGSGKSSLAFDTLFAEGQRRYLESLSSYARQFLGQLPKPDVDHIGGLSPAVAIQQKSTGWNPRSTVGTITQIHDYLRVLFGAVGRQHCPQCGRAISAQTREQLLARILELPAGTKVLLLAPKVRGQKGEYADLFADLLRQGYVRARVDGVVVSLTDPPALERNRRHDIEVVVDRLTIGPKARTRLAEAVEQALAIGEGTIVVQAAGEEDSAEANQARAGARPAEGRKRDLLLSSHYACVTCGISFEPPTPQLFSFNSPTGMCLECQGLGASYDFDPELLVPDPRKSFLNLAVAPMRVRIGRWRRHLYEGVARQVGVELKTPWKDLPEKARRALLYGLGDTHVTFEWRTRGGVWRHGGTFAGVVEELREKHRKAQSAFVRGYYEKFMRQRICASCKGARLNPQALGVRIEGRNLAEVAGLAVEEAVRFFKGLRLGGLEQRIAADVLKEIRGRLQFLVDVGLGYLSLDRAAPTLSGGESQRIRLAGQIGAGLAGVLYVLDEPSIGLHPRDNEKLLASLCRLRDMGNTVVVVEHDEQTMRVADEIVDFGPGPGVRGGEVVAQGDLEALKANARSLTGRYLCGEERIEVPATRRMVNLGERLRKRRSVEKPA